MKVKLLREGELPTHKGEILALRLTPETDDDQKTLEELSMHRSAFGNGREPGTLRLLYVEIALPGWDRMRFRLR